MRNGKSIGMLLALCALWSGRALAAPDRAHTLNVYAWAEYFPPALVAKFQAETGIKVNYATLDSPDMAETMLLAGRSNYDLVTQNASPHLAREIPAGVWRELDLKLIPNARNADPRILQYLAKVDPGNRHAIPWMWGTAGIIYNVDRIRAVMPDAPLESLDMVFRKDIVSRFANCGVSMLDSWGDILPMVSAYLHQPRLSADKASLDAVLAKLREIKPYIRLISTAGYYQQLAEGDLCLALGYSGDAMVARRMVKESGGHVVLNYSFPREVVVFYIDSLVIPADSPNPLGAQRFIDFVMRPENSAEVTRFIGFATGNAAALPLLEPAVRNNPIIYPPASIRDRMSLQGDYTPEESRAFTRVWQQFLSGT